MKKYTDEELELLSYDDLAYAILEESKKSIKITDLFRKVANIMKLTDSEYENRITDFFELLTTDKRFILLEKGFCDLRVNHSQKIVIEEDDEEYSEALETEDLPEEDEVQNIFDETTAPDEDEAEDDLKDLVVVDEEEEEVDDVS